LQEVGLHGLSTQEPRLQTLLHPMHPVNQQLSSTHVPALGPKSEQTLPPEQVMPEHGFWQPY